MNVQDRASFGLVAKYKCFEPYEKARACAQRVYETNEAVRRKMLELQDTKDQQEFLHESYTYILQKCEVNHCKSRGKFSKLETAL